MELQNKIVDRGTGKEPLPRAKSSDAHTLETKPHPQQGPGGCLIINADDWGRDVQTTDRILDCFKCHAVSSASGMVFMEDSERAASIAKQQGCDIGLHLNLSAPFSGSNVPDRLASHHEKIRRYLGAHPLARLVYHPGLVNSFEYVFAWQLEEFSRLYGNTPDRVDGHHHMHLSANVLLKRLLPSGTIVRRHFSYEPGEKVIRNSIFRLYSRVALSERYRVTDFFFSLPPLVPATRMQRIFGLSEQFVVELETHPINLAEYQFLTGGDLLRWTRNRLPARNFGKMVARHCALKQPPNPVSSKPNVA